MHSHTPPRNDASGINIDVGIFMYYIRQLHSDTERK
jgi:hypothetical protein